MMNFVLKTRNFVFKILNSAGASAVWLLGRAGRGGFPASVVEYAGAGCGVVHGHDVYIYVYAPASACLMTQQVLNV